MKRAQAAPLTRAFCQNSRWFSFVLGGYMIRTTSALTWEQKVEQAEEAMIKAGWGSIPPVLAGPSAGHCHSRGPCWRSARSSQIWTPNASSRMLGQFTPTHTPPPLPTRSSTGSRMCGHGGFYVTRGQGSTEPNLGLRKDHRTDGSDVEHHANLLAESGTGPLAQ